MCWKSHILGFFSKSSPTIYIDIQDISRGQFCAHFGENRMSGKNLVLEIWTEKYRKDRKIGYVWRLISRERKELSKIWFDFRNPRSFLYRKRHHQIFRILTPSPSKLSPNIGTEKSPNSGFSIFLSLGGRIFFILHSQLEDHKGLLQWRFHIHYIFGSEVIAIFGKWAQNLGPKTGFPIISSFDRPIKLKLFRQLEDH